MGSVVSYLDFVYMENPNRESLTSMTVCAGRTITGTTVHHNGHAGRTIVGMTVRRTCLFEDT